MGFEVGAEVIGEALLSDAAVEGATAVATDVIAEGAADAAIGAVTEVGADSVAETIAAGVADAGAPSAIGDAVSSGALFDGGGMAGADAVGGGLADTVSGSAISLSDAASIASTANTLSKIALPTPAQQSQTKLSVQPAYTTIPPVNSYTNPYYSPSQIAAMTTPQDVISQQAVPAATESAMSKLPATIAGIPTKKLIGGVVILALIYLTVHHVKHVKVA